MEKQIADASTSIRRWWWEYLRLSKDYWLLCKTCEPGQPVTNDEALAKIFCDFGNIYDCTFEDWWRRTGSKLFEERQLPPTVVEITSLESYATVERTGKILVEIPLQLTLETVQKQILRILEGYSDKRPTNRLEYSSSKYPITVALNRLEVLKKTHAVYCLHRELIDKPKALHRLGFSKEQSEYETRADLFRIGVAMKLSVKNERLIGTEEEIHRKLRNVRSDVSRFIARGQELLANVERGEFAKYGEPEPPPPRFSSAQDAVHLKLEEEWWSLDLNSSLNGKRIDDARRIHYSGD